jgi:hypothetical protein
MGSPPREESAPFPSQGELPVNGVRRMLGLAIALAAAVLPIIWGAWLVLLRAREPARSRLASYAEPQP